MAVTVALRGHALTTLDRVNAELTLTGDNGPFDSALNGYINSASGWFRTQCDRVFHAGKNIDELIAGNGRTRVRVARGPIRSVASVAISGAAVAVGDDWSIYNDNSGHPLQPNQLYRKAAWPQSRAIGGGLDVEGIAGEEQQNIEVVYDGGFVTRAQSVVGGVDGDVAFVGQAITLPDEIEDAVIQLVTSRWNARGRDIRVASRGYEATSMTFLGVPVPPEVATVVANYARIAHA